MSDRSEIEEKELVAWLRSPHVKNLDQLLKDADQRLKDLVKDNSDE